MPSSFTHAVLVTGPTGNTGSALLRLLENRGVAVRAMVRDERAQARLGKTGASVVIGNFDDEDSIRTALDGVESAYLVTPSSSEAEAQQIRFAELAAAAGVRHLVKLSQLAANEASPVRFLHYHAAIERRIRELGIGYTFLRPNLYFQGLLGFASTIAKEGRFFAPIGEARVSAVDVRDIAGVAAAALNEPGHIGKTYTITGPVAVTPEAFADTLRKFGMPEWQVDGLIEDYAHYARGEAAEVHPTVRGHGRATSRRRRVCARIQKCVQFLKRPARCSPATCTRRPPRGASSFGEATDKSFTG